VTTGGHGFRAAPRWVRFRLWRTTWQLSPSPAQGADGIRSLAVQGHLASDVPKVSTPIRIRNSSSKAVKWLAIEPPISYEGAEGSLLRGNGGTLAMSSSAIQFARDRNLPVGHGVHLCIQWPAALCDGTGLSLWATGTIRRSASCEVEVAIMRHEFRTRRSGGSTPSILLVASSAR